MVGNQIDFQPFCLQSEHSHLYFNLLLFVSIVAVLLKNLYDSTERDKKILTCLNTTISSSYSKASLVMVVPNDPIRTILPLSKQGLAMLQG